MVTSGAAPLIVYAFRRVRRRTSTDAFQTCDAGRAGVHLPSEAGTPDMTHRTCCRGSRGSASLPAPAAERLGPIVLLFLGLHTQKQSLPAVLFWNASWTGVGPNPPYPSAIRNRSRC